VEAHRRSPDLVQTESFLGTVANTHAQVSIEAVADMCASLRLGCARAMPIDCQELFE